MIAKEYLRKVLEANLELRSKEDELTTYRQDCYSISAIDYSKDRVTGVIRATKEQAVTAWNRRVTD